MLDTVVCVCVLHMMVCVCVLDMIVLPSLACVREELSESLLELALLLLRQDGPSKVKGYF